MAAVHWLASALLEWNRSDNQRVMPWKGEKDPYKIWLSEVMLQQTRVAQGIGYYEKFIAHFPTITDLAAADDELVFKLWEGLGYYSRCRNLLAAARVVTNEFGGVFPHTYEDILRLKGVGPYTAAAIASFAYQLPYAVVDGNVYRILSRCFGVNTPIDTQEGKTFFQSLATDILPKKSPGDFNQAMMDLGATICTPKSPNCDDCPLQFKCVAYKANAISGFPVKVKKLTIKQRYLHYLVCRTANQIAIRKRLQKDVWQDLHEFYLMEANFPFSPADWTAAIPSKLLPYVGAEPTVFLKQQLTHQLINGYFKQLILPKPIALEGYTWVAIAAIENFAFPKLLINYLKQENHL